ncbi:MAG: hypothetical protein ACREF9_11105 [Opitutaceae bacterium]
MFILHDGKVAGSDVAGGIFRGTYKLSDQKIAIRSQHQLPAGAQLATDGSTIGPEGFEIDVDVELDLDLGGGKPVRVETQAGPLNIIFQKISDI